MRKLASFLFLVLLLVLSAHTTSAQTRVQYASCSGFSISSLSCTFPSNPTPGNDIIVGLVTSGGIPGSITFSGISATPVTQKGCYINTLNASRQSCIFQAHNLGTVTGNTLTVNFPGAAYPGMVVVEYAGLTTDTDGSAGISASTSPQACGSITTTNAHDLVVAVAGDGSNDLGVVTMTGSPLFTRVTGVSGAGVGPNIHLAEYIATSTGTMAPSFTWTANTTQCLQMAFKAAGTATLPVRHRVEQ